MSGTPAFTGDTTLDFLALVAEELAFPEYCSKQRNRFYLAMAPGLSSQAAATNSPRLVFPLKEADSHMLKTEA